MNSVRWRVPASGRSEAEAARSPREVAGATRRLSPGEARLPEGPCPSLPENLRFSLESVAERSDGDRRGWGGVRCRAVAVRGGTQRGSREDEDGRRKDRRSERSERRGPQRAHRVLAAGALEVFDVDPQSVIYNGAAGDLAMFAIDPQSSTIYISSSRPPTASR